MQSAFAELGKDTLELEALDARPIVDNRSKQLAQARDVPLSARQIDIERPWALDGSSP